LVTVPVRVQERLVGRLEHPHVKGHRPTVKKVVHEPGHLQLRFLNHAGGIEPCLQIMAQPHRDEVMQRIPIPSEQLVQRLAVAGFYPLQQGAGLGRIGLQRWHG
jgi:hypothetical protein